MISVVVPTLNAAGSLAETLIPLIRAAVDGLVREVVVADGGSTDETLAIADDAGARLVRAGPSTGEQAEAGCAAAKGPWLMILYPGMRLGSEWAAAVKAHIEDHPKSAAYFRLALDDHRAGARLKEAGSAVAGLFAWPGADQGLVLPKRLYDEVGGFEAEGSLARRIGKARLRPLPARIFREG
jgi:glycosyltransferase involved in cell wall biosynthesis